MGNTAAIYIEPRSALLGISENASYALTEEQYEKCISTPEGILCRPFQPIHSESEDTSCEYDLLYRPINIDYRKCNVKYRDTYTSFWANTERNGVWIFSVNKPTELQIICKKRREYLTINATGILKIRSGCKAVAGRYQLQSPAHTMTPQAALIFPQIDLKVNENNSIIDLISKLKPLNFNETAQIDWTSDLSLWELEAKAKSVKDFENREGRYKFKMLLIIFTTAGVGSLLFGIIIAIICFRNIKNEIIRNEPEFRVDFTSRSGEINVPIEEIFDRFYLNRRIEVTTAVASDLPSLPV